MERKFLPCDPYKRFGRKNGEFLRALSGLCEVETTIIISESFRPLFNLLKLEGKSLPAIELEALVFTVSDAPVFLAFLAADLRGETGGLTVEEATRVYVAKLVRSLTSTIHTFSEDSISFAPVIVYSDELHSLGEKIAEARSRIIASRREMTEAAYDRLMDAVKAAVGLGAYVAGVGVNHPDKRCLVSDLKSNQGKRRFLSTLGDIILHMEDVQNPRISMGPVQTPDFISPTLVICSKENTGVIDYVRGLPNWKVATVPSPPLVHPLAGNVVVVDLDEDEISRIIDLSNAEKVIRIDSKQKTQHPTVSSMLSRSPQCVDLSGPSQETRKGEPEEATAKADFSQPLSKGRKERDVDIPTQQQKGKRSKVSYTQGFEGLTASTSMASQFATKSSPAKASTSQWRKSTANMYKATSSAKASGVGKGKKVLPRAQVPKVGKTFPGTSHESLIVSASQKRVVELCDDCQIKIMNAHKGK